jgi:hypothetical protein
MKKILIIGMILYGLLIVSINSATAIEESKTITDDRNDVIDLYAESEDDMYVSSKPNIDITKFVYDRKDKSVTLTLTVKGEIEDRGNIDDLFSEDEETMNYDYVAYTLEIANEEGFGYQIYYINKKARLTYYSPDVLDYEVENLSSSNFDVQGDTLTVNFELKNNTDTFDDINVGTEDAKVTVLVQRYYLDLAPDDELDLDNGNENGNTDTNGDNGGTFDSAFLMFIGLIVVIAVAGVVVLILIIRR